MSALAFALGVVVGWWAGARRSRVRVDFRRDHEPAVDLDWREPYWGSFNGRTVYNGSRIVYTSGRS